MTIHMPNGQRPERGEREQAKTRATRARKLGVDFKKSTRNNIHNYNKNVCMYVGVSSM